MFLSFMLFVNVCNMNQYFSMPAGEVHSWRAPSHYGLQTQYP